VAGSEAGAAAYSPAAAQDTGIGWLGGLTGSLMDRYIWHLGPKFVEIQVAAAAIGCALFILAAGLWPFLKILAGQTGTRRV